eukprot:56730_1
MTTTMIDQEHKIKESKHIISPNISDQEAADNKSTNTDLKICDTSSTECNKKETEIIQNCDHLKRAMVALKYYDQVCAGNISDKQRFSKFCVASYHNFLNDYIHIITKHGDNVLKIVHELKKQYGFQQTCKIKTCDVFTRHYNRTRRGRIKDNIDNENEDEVDTKQEFYCEYFDQLHHFMFHLYQIGLRTKINDNGDDDAVNNDIDNDMFN